MNQIDVHQKADELYARWQELKTTKPNLRIRDCAEELAVSEADLLATTVGTDATRLAGDWTKLVMRLPELGRVMSLTRNKSCVLEHKGPFQKIDIIPAPGHTMATVIGPIESRIFFSGWKYGFAVKLLTPHGMQQSIQIFDETGTAVTKIFMTEANGQRPGSNQEAFDRLVTDFKSAEQGRELTVSVAHSAPTLPPDEVDKVGLLSDWSRMKDTHDFFGILRKHKVSRYDAIRISENMFSYRLQPSTLRKMLESAAAEKIPIMIFAGNRGNLQIHQGLVKTIRVMDHWLNILDPDFNMHLREDHIESAWVVKKPTADGAVTAIEVFDKEHEMIVQFFGLRKPGIPELDTWKELVTQLEKI